MNISKKNIFFYALLFIISINQLQAQYQSGDYLSASLLSDELYAPGRMAIDTLDNLYVVDAFKRNIVKYNSQGNFLNTINIDFTPLSIAVNNKNQLFVGDKETGDIYAVQSNGSKVLFYSGLSFPASMEFGANNILYVVDSEQLRVIGLDVSGALVKDFTYGTFTFPNGIAFDHQNNHILVSEHGGIGPEIQDCGGGCSMCWSDWGPVTTIYIFDINGNFVSQFGCFGYEDAEFQRIQDLSVGACGNIYATDPYLGRVSVFEPNGNFITSFGSQGNGPGEFNLPTDIVFSSDNRAFISSMNKGEVDVLSITFSLPSSTITSDDKAICAGTTTDITVEFTGVAPWEFTYTIDDLNPVPMTATESPFSFTVDVEGLYKIDSLTDGNGINGTCFTGSTRVTVSTEPPTATINTTELTKCSDDTTGIELQFTGMAPWTFTYTVDGLDPTEITTNQDLYVLEVDQTGLYEFLDLYDDACTGDSLLGTVLVTVNPLPTATIDLNSNQIQIPPGATANIDIYFTGSAPYTFTYSRNEDELNTITTSDDPYTFSLTEEGTYEILFISDLYCLNDNWQGFFDIAFHDLVTPTATLVTSEFYLCPDETADLQIDLTGTPPWTFSYSLDGIEQGTVNTETTPYILTTSLSGVYELTSISDENTSGTYSGTATLITLDLPVVDLPEEVIICEGDPAFVLDAGEHDSYLWSDGSTERTLVVSTTGEYSVTVTNASGCTASDTAVVSVLLLPDAFFYYSTNALEVQFVSDAYNADSHYWDFGDGTFSTEENPIHVFPSKGTYSVTYTAISDHCGTSDYGEDIYVSNKPNKEVVHIYPNPSNGDFTVVLSPNEPIIELIEIYVHSMSGEPIYYGTFDPNSITSFEDDYFIEISVGNFSNGLHVVTVNAGNLIGQTKLILQH
jgi:PKD repeat protein